MGLFPVLKMFSYFPRYGGLVGEDSDIESTVSKQLFLDKMMTLDPAAYTQPGLRLDPTTLFQ